MSKLHQAILNTLSYADIFDYPLTETEIHRWLIDNQAIQSPLGSELQALADPERSRGTSSKPLIEQTKNYYHLSGRQPIVNLRTKRQRFSQPKLLKAKQISNFLKYIPSINLIAITGALAMNNSDESDDIDLMIITKTNRLWLTRLLTIIILELFHLRRRPQKHSIPGWNVVSNLKDKFCLNLFLDESALTIPVSRRNLYIAHEVAQVKPLFDRGETYQKFLRANLWVKNFLPNIGSKKGLSFTGDLANGQDGTAKLEGQSLRDSRRISFLNTLNHFAFKFQHWYMAKKLTREKVSLHSAFFHPRPTGKIVLSKYQKRLHRIGYEPIPVTVLVTGVFDILHREHKKFLQKAKKQGDLLLIGLETDTRVKRLKGSTRPINPLQTRIKNIEKWGIADQVFALPKKFDSDQDHLKLLQKIKPDILAISSHTSNLPTKRRLMASIGGTIKVVHSHNPKISVTKLLKQNIK